MMLCDSAMITLHYDACVFVCEISFTNQILYIFAVINLIHSTNLTLNNKMVYLDLQLLVSRNILNIT